MDRNRVAAAAEFGTLQGNTAQPDRSQRIAHGVADLTVAENGVNNVVEAQRTPGNLIVFGASGFDFGGMASILRADDGEFA